MLVQRTVSKLVRNEEGAAAGEGAQRLLSRYNYNTLRDLHIDNFPV
jgi:hypothetical protein